MKTTRLLFASDRLDILHRGSWTRGGVVGQFHCMRWFWIGPLLFMFGKK